MKIETPDKGPEPRSTLKRSLDDENAYTTAVQEEHHVGKTVFSRKTKARFAHLKNTFFWSLPYHKRVALLKRTEGMKSTSVMLASDLAREYQLPLEKVKFWLKDKRIRNIKRPTTAAKLTAEHRKMLNEEFAVSASLDEGRALTLAHLWRLPVGAIRRWFSIKRFKRASGGHKKVPKKGSDSASTEDRTKPAVAISLTPMNMSPVSEPSSGQPLRKKLFLPEQTMSLFEAFKRSSAYIPERAEELIKNNNLTAVQITCWFSKMRAKLATASLNSIKKSLSQNLKTRQIEDMEREYRKRKCISIVEAQSIATRLGVNRSVVEYWFSNRRFYEIFKIHGNYYPADVDDEVMMILEAEDAVLYDDDGDHALVGFSTASNTLIKGKPTLLDTLPPFKQTRLLNEYKNLKGPALTQVANELDIPRDKLMNWARNRRYMDTLRQREKIASATTLLKTSQPPTSTANAPKLFTPDQLQVLEEAFAKNDRVHKEEVIELAQKIGNNVHYSKIINWFMNRRYKERVMSRKFAIHNSNVEANDSVKEEEEAKAGTPPEPFKTSVRGGKLMKTVAQHNRLFEEFKKSSIVSGERADEIGAALNLTGPQISLWFVNVRKKLSGKTREDALKVLTPMSNVQLAKLTTEYHKNRFITDVKCRILAKQLNVSKRVVSSWFFNARLYELITGERFKMQSSVAKSTNLAAQQTALPKNESKSTAFDSTLKTRSFLRPGKITRIKELRLEAAFGEIPEPSYEQIKKLSQHLHIRMDKIKRWFENRKMSGYSEPKLDVTIEDDTNVDEVAARTLTETPPIFPEPWASKTSAHKYVAVTPSRMNNTKLPRQQNMLFKAFKVSPHLTAERVIELSKQLDLSMREISLWFSWMRKKLSMLSTETLLDSYRNRNLTERQVELLEIEFHKSPYISQEDREALADRIGISPGSIKMWFANRRYYDIVFHSNDMQESEDAGRKASDSSDTESDSPDTDERDDFNPVITYISSVHAVDGMNNISIQVEDDGADVDMKYSDVEEQLPENIDPLKHAVFMKECEDTVSQISQSSNEFLFVGDEEQSLKKSVSTQHNLFLSEDETFELQISQISNDFNNVADDDVIDLQKVIEVDTSSLIALSHNWNLFEKTRYIAPLTDDDQPADVSVNDLLWYICLRPNASDNDTLTPVMEAALETEYAVETRPRLSRIYELSEQLQVSQQRIYWWFVMKRFNSKYASKPCEDVVPHVDLIDLTSEETDLGSSLIRTVDDQFEFVELEDNLETDNGLCTNENDVDDPANILSRVPNADDPSDTWEDIEQMAPKIVDSDTTGLNMKSVEPAKKGNIALSTQQSAILIHEFKRSRFVSNAKARMLASILDLTVTQVEQWFERKRSEQEDNRQNGIGDVLTQMPEIILSPAQQLALEAEYRKDAQLTQQRLKALSYTLKATKETVLHWFNEKKKNSM